MTVTCLIIDDELTARRGMQALLEDFPELRLLGTCSNGVEAIDDIRSLKPDLIFLDVQMPGISGFEVLASLPKPWPQVVFTTAHDQFALKAFEVAAVDYLLKPFSDERFAEAVERAKKQLALRRGSDAGVQSLLGQTQASLRGTSAIVDRKDERHRLVIRSEGSIHLLDHADVSHVEAYDYYVKVHVKDRFFLLRETMKKMEERLPGELFVRIHKSFIVNLSFVKAAHLRDSHEYEVELQTGAVLKVSRNFKAGLMERLGIG